MRLAQGFGNVVRSECPGEVPLPEFLRACATFFGSYLVQLPPNQRAISLAEMTDEMFRVLHENCDADLEFFQ
jgi:hypothetical protein